MGRSVATVERRCVQLLVSENVAILKKGPGGPVVEEKSYRRGSPESHLRL